MSWFCPQAPHIHLCVASESLTPYIGSTCSLLRGLSPGGWQGDDATNEDEYSAALERFLEHFPACTWCPSQIGGVMRGGLGQGEGVGGRHDHQHSQHARTHIHTRARKHVFTHTHTHTQTHVHALTHTCTQTHTHKHARTHTHTNTHSSWAFSI